MKIYGALAEIAKARGDTTIAAEWVQKRRWIAPTGGDIKAQGKRGTSAALGGLKKCRKALKGREMVFCSRERVVPRFQRSFVTRSDPGLRSCVAGPGL